jgi:Domain of unknown function (DUF1858)
MGQDTKVFDVIENHPETVAVFLKFGFTMIENPMARQIFARSASLDQACRMKHVNCGDLLSALDEVIARTGGCQDPAGQQDTLARISPGIQTAKL